MSVIMDDWKLCHKIDTQTLLRARTELADYDVSVVEGDVSAERMLAILMAARAFALIMICVRRYLLLLTRVK